MALSPTSDESGCGFSWSRAGEPIASPEEWCEYSVATSLDPSLLSSIRVSANDAPLDVSVRSVEGVARVVVAWPRRGPGTYIIRVDDGTGATAHQVRIASKKLGDDGLRQLTEQLENELPTLVALGLQRLGGLAGLVLVPRTKDTLAQEVLRLRRAIEGTATRPGLKQILRRLAREHHRILVTTNEWKSRVHARRPHPAYFHRALCKPNNTDRNGKLRSVLDQIAQHSVDVYENQVVKLFTHQVRQRVHVLLGGAGPGGSGALRDELESLRKDLRAAIHQAEFLAEVSLPSTPPRRLTMVLLRNPAYRAAIEGLLEFQRSVLVVLDDPLLGAPLDNLPRLYQRWCTLRVVDEVLGWAALRGLQVVTQRVVHLRQGAAFVEVLRDGTPAVVLRDPASKSELCVTPERTFGAAGDLRSMSFAQRPDISIELRDQGGYQSVLLLDPKYKLDSDGDPETGAPLKVDVDKMHAYRDAIRSSDGAHVVSHAATIYPGPTRHYGGGVSALCLLPSATQTIRGELVELLDRLMCTRSDRQAVRAEPRRASGW